MVNLFARPKKEKAENKFTVLEKDIETRARRGILKTSHGEIKTPAYVIVGTHAEVRFLKPDDLQATKTQLIISNTYHLWQALGKNLKKYPGLHKAMRWPKPIMTDSGGFQVFSLGFGREHGVGKISNIFPEENKIPPVLSREKNMVKITNRGAFFKINGKKYFLGPKESIKIQKLLGADIILAFDECTSPLHDYNYTKKSLLRTHKWAKICLKEFNRHKHCHCHNHGHNQFLYGIVQGGEWRNLREKSAEFIGSLPFDGFAIGGSLGKSRNDMLSIIDWTTPFLPEEKPRHLLGIGKIEDLLDGIERGIDTFDCVIPTREARHGAIWTKSGRYDILKSKHLTDPSPLTENCPCPTCDQGKIKKKDLYALFKSKNPEAARYATIHNVYFFNSLMEKIRNEIGRTPFSKIKENILSNLNQKA